MFQNHLLFLFEKINNDLLLSYANMTQHYAEIKAQYDLLFKSQRNCTFALALAEKLDYQNVKRVPFTFSNIWNHLNLTEEFGQHFTIFDFIHQQQSGISAATVLVLLLGIFDRVIASKLAKKFNIPQATWNKLFCATLIVVIRIIAMQIEAKLGSFKIVPNESSSDTNPEQLKTNPPNANSCQIEIPMQQLQASQNNPFLALVSDGAQ